MRFIVITVIVIFFVILYLFFGVPTTPLRKKKEAEGNEVGDDKKEIEDDGIFASDGQIGHLPDVGKIPRFECWTGLSRTGKVEFFLKVVEEGKGGEK